MAMAAWLPVLLLLVTTIWVFSQSPSSTFAQFDADLTAGVTPDLPDFSYAGRNLHADEPPLATSTTHTIIHVADYGAVADDGRSDRRAVVEAIAAAEAAAPAIVMFGKGRYILRDVQDVNFPAIRISKSGIVLRGEGMYRGGTELVALCESAEDDLIRFEPDLTPVNFRGRRELSKFTVPPKRGDTELQLVDASAIQVGDIVRVVTALPDTFDEFSAFFENLGLESDVQRYFDRYTNNGSNTSDFRGDFESQVLVTGVSGNTVTIAAPLVAEHEHASPTVNGGPRVMQNFEDGEDFMQDSGIEDLALTAAHTEQFKHFYSRGMDGYDLLVMRNVRHCHARRVRFSSGTRSLTLEGNGIANTFYDLLLEGNAGHYSITVVGSYFGTQFSFIREESANHHGLGATDSAFGTVYHRCNTFGGPEGHSGYPQATLLDRGEGDLAIRRVGGAAPHISKRFVIWNWRQEQFARGDRGLPNDAGNSFSETLGARSVDFWPDLIQRPYLIGLHGQNLAIDNAADETAVNESQGAKVLEDSLFESQLQRRLGVVPGWIAQRAASFEAITRHTRISIASPRGETNFLHGEAVPVVPAFPTELSLGDVARIDLYASRGQADVDEKRLVATSSVPVSPLHWTPPAAGGWCLWLVLTNSLGEQAVSHPRFINVAASSAVEWIPPVDAWLQPRSLGARSISDASNGTPWTRPEVYRAAIRAIERPLVEPAVDDTANRAIAGNLIDGDPLTTNSASAPRFFGFKGFVYDLGSDSQIDFIEIECPPSAANGELVGRYTIQTSSAAGAQYSYSNNDLTWQDVRRFGEAEIDHRLRLDSDARARIALPAGTRARYVRLLIDKMDSPDTSRGSISELRFGRDLQQTDVQRRVLADGSMRSVNPEFPGIIEAEDYLVEGSVDNSTGNNGGGYRSDDVDIERNDDVLGGNFNVGFTAVGERLRYLVDVPRGGRYDLIVRAASNVATGKVSVLHDGLPLGELALTSPTGWQSYQDLVLSNVFLPSGADQELVLEITGAQINLNWIEARLKAPVIDTNFDEGSYEGWVAHGTGFGLLPATGTLPGQSEVSGYEGVGFVNTALNGSGDVGVLVSPLFEITANFIHFLIGGGQYPERTGIRLELADGTIVRSSTGSDSEILAARKWEVSDLVGQMVRLRIVDLETGQRGHITIDSIRQDNVAGTSPLDPAIDDPTPPLTPASTVSATGVRHRVAPGFPYDLEESQTLLPGSWSRVGALRIGLGAEQIEPLTDTAPQIFYRLAVTRD